MKIENIARKLAELTSNLSSLSPEDEEYLETIRRVLGYNLRNNRQNISELKLQAAELEFAPSKSKIQQFTKYAVSELYKEDNYLIRRIEGEDIVPVVGVQMEDIRLPFNPIQTFDEIRWNQKRDEQIGPFLSEEGRSIWFDFYYYEDKLTVRSQNGSIPYFLFSKAKEYLWLDTFESTQTVSLEAGYVWILGKLFTNDAGDNEYLGFNIKGGEFSLVNKNKWNDQYLDFEGNFTGKLTIQLVQSEKNNATFEGCKAAQSIDFQYPNEVTFEWENGELKGITSTEGDFTGYGNKLKFSNFTLPAEYPHGLNHIFIPCEIEPTKWVTDFSQSRIFDAKGKADIKKAFWALPVVRVSNPATLGEPENNGGWGLQLSSELSAKWIGSDEQQPNAILHDTLLLLYPQALFLYSEKTTIDVASTNKIKQDFSCWQISSENHARIPLSLNYQDVFPLIYYCHAIEGETLLASCMGQIQPDRPVFAEGSHISMQDLKGWVIFQDKKAEIKINALLGNEGALKKPFKPLALENALMVVSQPTDLVLEGILTATNHNSIEKGRITLLHGLLQWKPILPDPYVSNLQEGWNIDRPRTFSSKVFAQTSWEQPDKPVVTFKGNLSLLLGVDIKRQNKPVINSLPVQLDEKTLEDIEEHTINGEQRENKNQIDGLFDEVEEILSGWKLLDVSTNMDLIGVSISPSLMRGRNTLLATTVFASEVSLNKAFVVKGMAVNTPLSAVHVFTVPQVQWEPVRTLPEDQNIAALGWFPENLGSATDGGPTRIIGFNQELAPIVPDIVVRQIQKSFTDGSPATALTTLSFGLKTILKISPQSTDDRNADSLDIVQPAFPQKGMQGGIQINLMAESGNPRPRKDDNRSPGFEGFMAQTLNGYELFTGTELGISVLGATYGSDGSVESQFNKEFSHTGSAPFVPVTRFDLSGYGESNFSEWDNPEGLASVGKVQFKIMVGRTAFEVVKFVSKIYPWGSTVTRSVIIERRSGGGMIRKDSGWQSTQAGIFDFRAHKIPDNPYQFSPGIFRGCFDLKNIRPASDNIIKFNDPANGNNVELAPVYFDANVQLDGQVDGNTFSQGILGFIQLEPKPDAKTNLPKELSVAALQKLIVDQGAIGGPIDTVLNIGNSGLRFRATRFEVDVADNGGTPNFIGIVRGQPALPNNGSWSVIKMAAPGNTVDPQEAVTADVSRGTPLFIENKWLPPSGNVMIVDGPIGPYRFADPVDLFAPQPRFDYGFMQNTGSQAFLYRRPVIVPGTNEISSNLKPAFADPFAMLTSKGVFPPIANTVEFPTANYKLLIQSVTGKFQLNTPVNLNNLRTPLMVVQDGSNQVVIEYDQSLLKFDLNFDDWNVELDNFFVWTSLLGISKLTGTRFSLRAGKAQQAKLVNVQSLLKPEIQDALSFLPGMGSPGNVDDIDLGMTNADHEIKIKAGFRSKNLIPKPLNEHLRLILFGNAGVDPQIVDPNTKVAMTTFGTKFGAEVQGKLGKIQHAIFGGEIEVGFSSSFPFLINLNKKDSWKSLKIEGYVGYDVGGKMGPFCADAYAGAGVVFALENNSVKFGFLVKCEAQIQFKEIVNLDIFADLYGVYNSGTKELEAYGEAAVNVSICLVIDIHASYPYKATVKLPF
ncbi:hypothetical protein P4414_04130 [Bacillus thuringiensis]|nr:hypothetical protein [Bacillus thuringiensis]